MSRSDSSLAYPRRFLATDFTDGTDGMGEGRGEMEDGRWEMEERRCVVSDGGERSDQSRLLGADFCVEPGAGVGPVTFGGAFGNAQQRGGFSNGHANEVAEFDQVGFLFVFRSEFFQ